ncbi:MAG: hypothetical protein J6T72_00130 [Alphaproteobacteria bacterium]|nr:hypothetical protein [Alphaproteobacteria bacterium]
MTSVENKRREKLQELNNKKINQLRMRTAKKADKVAKKVGVNTNFEKALSERLERRAK